MGWIKDLFKRKKGGTKVGNAIRGIVSAATDGALGQGRDLADYFARQNGTRATVADYAVQQHRLQQDNVFVNAQNAAFAPTSRVRGQFQAAYQDRVVGKTGNFITNWLSAPLQGSNLLITALLAWAAYRFTNRNKKK